jgi:PD-(D/E)XK nuclease superfamily
MPDGVLHFAPVIRSITSFSPTRYTAFLECPLQAIWTAIGVPALLPFSPSARIGSVAHALLQEAGEGKFSSSTETVIRDRWDELVRSVEVEMEKRWQDRHFIPLQMAVPQYEVRRLQSCKRALDIKCEEGTYVRNDARAQNDDRRYGFELWVSSRDGAIRGRIDAVLPSAEGPVLRDYKSGGLFDDGTREVKQEYEVQLKLYAALYADSCGYWPSILELVPLTGPPHALVFESTSCIELLKKATDALHGLNRLIETTQTQEDLEADLARPAPKNCSYCQYRPGCRSYRKAAGASGEWPTDVLGRVSVIQELGNSKYMLTLSTSVGVARIRGLDSKPLRHPALRMLNIGDRVGIFNLSTRTQQVYLETPYTTIYKMETEKDELSV